MREETSYSGTVFLISCFLVVIIANIAIFSIAFQAHREKKRQIFEDAAYEACAAECDPFAAKRTKEEPCLCHYFSSWETP